MGTAVEGGTPTTRGINCAVASSRPSRPASLDYILLITDGAANCNPDVDQMDNGLLLETYDETLAPTVTAAKDDGITTFVVGIDIVDMHVNEAIDGAPAANPFQRLNEVALAGGAPKNMGMDAEKFFNSTNEDELLLALRRSSWTSPSARSI